MTPSSLSNGGSMHQKQPPAKIAFCELEFFVASCCESAAAEETALNPAIKMHNKYNT